MAQRVLSKVMVSAAFLLALAGSGAAAEKPKVVATFTIVGDLVEAVGGDAVTVTTLVGPDGDAHEGLPVYFRLPPAGLALHLQHALQVRDPGD